MQANLQNPEQVVETIFDCFQQRGHQHYGEDVTEQEHALQCAYLAAQAGDPEGLVAACLLHDIGHLLHDLGENIAEQGIDAVHEEKGAVWLAGYFPPEIVEPVRLHVAAKRYLCTREPGYAEALSEASALSLSLQGGPMSEAEAVEFEQGAHADWAVRLRRYDDHGKLTDLEVPLLESYRELLIAVQLS
ncbi:MAG: HD domain-containing protein [Armatimonas sp.]